MTNFYKHFYDRARDVDCGADGMTYHTLYDVKDVHKGARQWIFLWLLIYERRVATRIR